MQFFGPPCCSLCGSPLPLVKVWWKADTARGMYLCTKTGVSCPMCGAKFIILQARAVLVGIIICFGSPVLALSAAFGLERRLSHHLNSFAMVVVLIVALALTTAAHIL